MSRTHIVPVALLALCLLPTAALAGAKPLTVSHDGVGPVHKDMTLSNAAMRRMFKGCHVASSTKTQDRKPTEKVFEVTCHNGSTYVWTLHSARDLETLASAEVNRPGTRTPEGITVGMTMADVYKLGQVDCDADVNPSVVRCVFLGDTSVAYSAKDTTKDADGNLPPEDAIKRLKITSIIWRANMM